MEQQQLAKGGELMAAQRPSWPAARAVHVPDDGGSLTKGPPAPLGAPLRPSALVTLSKYGVLFLAGSVCGIPCSPPPIVPAFPLCMCQYTTPFILILCLFGPLSVWLGVCSFDACASFVFLYLLMRWRAGSSRGFSIYPPAFNLLRPMLPSFRRKPSRKVLALPIQAPPPPPGSCARCRKGLVYKPLPI